MADSTPTTLFSTYEQDFHHIIQSLKTKLETKNIEQGSGGVEQRKAILRSVDVELDDADDIVGQLELEIQGIPNSIKPQYASRLKQVKLDLAKYKKAAKDLQTQVSRTELLLRSNPSASAAGQTSGASDDPYTDRARLLTGHQMLNDGSRRLADSTSLALRTEEMGADILRTLRGQRETIEHAHDTVGNAEINIDRASGTLKGMISRMYQQRVIMGLILAFFITLVIVILYFKFRR
ncbi:vesicle transport v-snare protein vti1 [Pluteus cervinus]|uniref:Vesicle transport v-snare protein vti1 n=1 Tax=Pluteus cervinus TaxID=181527 RepID=A0ACD3AN55_9AGAR|nr:vesicle transport v-snare protein vti1 [Pluteus cervinus]